MTATEKVFGISLPPAVVQRASGGAAAVFVPMGDGRWDAHFATRPEARGSRAAQAFRRILAWFWSNHEVADLVGCIDQANAPARHMAVALGFQRVGIYGLPWSDGIVRQTVLYRQTRPEAANDG